MLISRLVDFSLDFLHVWALEQGCKSWLSLEDIDDLSRRVVGGGSLVDKDDYLLAHAENAAEVLEDDLVHDVVSSLGISHLLHAIKGTLKRCRTVACVKAKRARGICIDEVGHVQVVRQRGRQTYQSDRLLKLKSSGEGAGDEALEDETSLVVKQVDLVNDHAVD